MCMAFYWRESCFILNVLRTFGLVFPDGDSDVSMSVSELSIESYKRTFRFEFLLLISALLESS